MLQGCLNGSRTKSFHPATPCTPEELARDAEASVRAGAEELHIHPRGADGAESLTPDDIGRALLAVRGRVPGIPIGVSTRWPIRPGGRARQADIRGWEILPDYVSVNLVEEDASEVIGLALSKGVGIEAGVWSVADADRLVRLPEAERCLRVLIEINEQDEAEARAVAEGILAVLDRAGIALPRLLHGYEATKWPICRMALARGLDSRIGLEDGAHLPSGERAADNAGLLRAARQLASAAG
ncbi:3-keto-5-aminohexanoate cleavage protein [Inquilinus sp. NPDC058860]|uniref:3-keto-5-aminohexanoate cleavage protein n=1 Tax=Inquilinus sp. NPDC058860 TaxID=3346652 RepID=UPI0036B628D8